MNLESYSPLYFPSVPLTRKIHEFVFEVPRFVKERRTVGLFSEEEEESIHHHINLESVQLASVRDSFLKVRLLLERHEQRSQSDCSLLAAQPRKCKKCTEQGGTTYLKNRACSVHGAQ